jgi:hypothetical protein
MTHSFMAIDLQTNNTWCWRFLVMTVLTTGLAGCGGSGGSGGTESSVYSVTAVAETGGAITPTSQQIEKNKTAQFTLTPAAGNKIASVTGCNGSLAGSTYTTGPITAACEVRASFTLSSYTLTASAGEGGSISPGSAAVNHGSVHSFTITPQTGYTIASVTGCNGSLAGSTYTTGPITAACEVRASFTLNSYTLTAFAGEGGTISPGTATVNHGSVHSFTITPQTGYTIASVTGCTGSLSGNTYRTGPITSACNVQASFAFVPVGGFNDTGIGRCANTNTNNLNCPIVGFEGQDGELGRDAKARTGTLTKIGGGAAGFDYTKIAADGSVLAIQNVAWDANGSEAAGSQWRCVRDNVTGLIWEVKTAEGGLRDMNHTYTWYNPDINTNGGDAGMQNGGICTGSDCDTHAFVQAVNRQNLCGANDWRLPTRFELMGIAHNGRSLPAIDTAYFPNTQNIAFWTSSPMAIDSSYAWNGHFFIGGIYGSRKNVSSQVRLVRVGR